MRSRSISLEERLKQAVSTEKVEETKVITKIDNICISEDENENKYLIEKTIEVLNIQSKASLELGKIFNEVSEKVKDESYCKWLEINGFNRTTAFRHRRRHSLYEEVSHKDGKEIIALCGYRDIDKIFQSEDRENYINILNAGNINLKEFRNLLNGNLLENKLNKQNSIVNINFENYSNFFTNFSEKVNTLDDEKKILLEKYLKKIEELWK